MTEDEMAGLHHRLTGHEFEKAPGVGDAIQPFLLRCTLLLLPSIFPSIRVFSNESAVCIRWPKYQSFSFSFSISPSNEYSGLISFRIFWFDLLAVQGVLKSLLQHHSLKACQYSLSGSETSQFQKLCLGIFEGLGRQSEALEKRD